MIKKILFTIFTFFILSTYVCALELSIDSVTVVDQSDTVIYDDTVINELIMNPSIQFTNLNDYITFRIKFNGSDLNKYRIVNVTDDNNNTHIKTSYVYDRNTSEYLYLTMQYDNALNGTLNMDNIHIDLSLMDDQGSPSSASVPAPSSSGDNPDTGRADIIFIPIIAILCALIAYKQYSRMHSYMVVIALLLLVPCYIYAVESMTVRISIITSSIIVKEAEKPSSSSSMPEPSSGSEPSSSSILPPSSSVNPPSSSSSKPSSSASSSSPSSSGGGTPTGKGILLIAGHSFPPYCTAYSNECRGTADSGYDETVETRSFVRALKSKLISVGYSSSDVDIANELMGENFSDQSTTKSLFVELIKRQNGQANAVGNIDFSKYAYAIEIHFNAFSSHTAAGVTTVCPNSNCGLATNINAEIRRYINSVQNNSDRGAYPLDTATYYFFQSLNIPFTYLEAEFYDNKTAMDKWKANESNIALGIAQIIKNEYPH